MKPAYEILAPAGNMESLQAAVQNGAHAVYLSGHHFGARKFAANFDREELREAVAYCHIRGVSVYVTVNILVLNREWESLKAYIDFLYEIDVDALIVQDMGVLAYVRQAYPDLDIHCSTQMSVQTVEDIRFLESMGVRRVVLGREMTLDDIRRARQETQVALEVFVHGALCISVSGQCLMSSLIGGRSGNRGRCAQPCRQKYRLYCHDEDKMVETPQGEYLLSPKDLYTLEQVREILEAGAFSLKIEGRMKRPEYVAAAVGAYRSAIDAAYGAAEREPAMDHQRLSRELKVFNRGFTRGHVLGDRGAALMSMGSPGNQGYPVGKVITWNKAQGKLTMSLSEDLQQNDEIQIRRGGESVGARVERLEWKGTLAKSVPKGQTCTVNFKEHCTSGEWVYKTYDDVLMKEIRQRYHKEFLTIPVSMAVIIEEGEPITGQMSDGTHTVTAYSNHLPQKAMKRSLTREEAETQLTKLGGTPYRVDRITLQLSEGLSVPMKVLNELRRDLVEQLNGQRAIRHHRGGRAGSPLDGDTENTQTADQPSGTAAHAREVRKAGLQLTYAAANLDQLKALLDLKADVIYYKDMETLEEAADIVGHSQLEGFFPHLIPEVFRLSSDSMLKKYLNIISGLKLDTVLIQGIGHINAFQSFNLVGDFPLNVVNDHAASYYRKLGFQRITLSPELTLAQMEVLDLEPARTEIIGFGALPVMAMKHCVVATVTKGQVNCNHCRTHRYSLVDKMNAYFPLHPRSGCTNEIYHAQRVMLLEDHQELFRAGVGFFRLNFLYETPEEVRQVVSLHRKWMTAAPTPMEDSVIRKLKESGVTKGHLYRGVE